MLHCFQRTAQVCVGIGTCNCQRASLPFPPKPKVGLFGNRLIFMLGIELGVSHRLTTCSATLSMKQKDPKCLMGLRIFKKQSRPQVLYQPALSRVETEVTEIS